MFCGEQLQEEGKHATSPKWVDCPLDIKNHISFVFRVHIEKHEELNCEGWAKLLVG
jgi:hypothetical protein